MKFSIGDNVLLKRSGEEGIVVAIINKQMVEVDVKGVTFPTYIDDIDHPYLKWFTDNTTKKKVKSIPEQLPVEKIPERKQRLAKGVYISFLPVFKISDMEEVVDFLKVFILNELPVDIMFKYDVRIEHKCIFSLEGKLNSFGNLYLHNIAYEDMNDQPRFNWTLTDTLDKNSGVEEGVLRIRPAKLFEHISNLQANNEPSFSY